ncbi:sugar transporter [Rhodanobacter sp. B04]|uniref:LPS translocon maturation chaperone LptM n=1 Tax=Rhodanobacter sp. B04 TaxID=1945860 RepID=UPI000985619B|nr:lipoprotein [Rhodanobacter sp. B04]OOG62499.1 sugar transporter [Rhodanobacter sp. B04]
MRRSLLLPPLCLVVALLAGCGQKGPLVLPPTKPASASSTAKPRAPAPASSVETQDQDNDQY